jgi:N-acyl-L-homoserine lactone synthetase
MIDGHGFHVAEPRDGDVLPALNNMGDDARSDSVWELSRKFTCNGPSK